MLGTHPHNPHAGVVCLQHCGVAWWFSVKMRICHAIQLHLSPVLPSEPRLLFPLTIVASSAVQRRRVFSEHSYFA